MKRFERNGYGSFLAVLAALLLSTSTRVEAQTVDLAALEAKVELSRESLEKVEHGITAMEEESGGAQDTLLEERRPLSIYGFMDFGYDRWWLDDPYDDIALVAHSNNGGAFAFGSLNLYLSAQPTSNLRSLVEMRYVLAPHGEPNAVDLTRQPPLLAGTDQDAHSRDSPGAQLTLRLGSIFIERAWAEWTVNDYLKVRAGLFLNPFGIWNVDHGSPTLIALMIPTFVASQMMPARLAGIQALGSVKLGEWLLQYHAHVSNGRSFALTDPNNRKGVGGRAVLSRRLSTGPLAVGVSGFYDHSVDYWGSSVGGEAEGDGQGVDSSDPASEPGFSGEFQPQRSIDYDEIVIGLDASLDLWDLMLRAEYVAAYEFFNDGYREPLFAGFEAPNDPKSCDCMQWEAFMLAALRTKWGTTPFAICEIARKGLTVPLALGVGRRSDDTPVLAYGGGINQRLGTHSQIKTQLTYVIIDQEDPVRNRFPLLFTRWVTTF